MQLPFQVKILGSSSAVPTKYRATTSQVVIHNQQPFLIDCGEGTIAQMKKFDVSFPRINHIFISHSHGDHIFGLMGVLTSLNLYGRSGDLHIYCDDKVIQYIEAIKSTMSIGEHQFDFGYPLIHHPLNKKEPECIFSDKNIEVYSMPLDHNGGNGKKKPECHGFLFKEKEKPRKIIKEMIKTFEIPIKDIVKIKEGADFTTDDGRLIPNSKLTQDPAPPRSYAFISDTRPMHSLIDYLKGTSVIYHEATFDHSRLEDAVNRGHSTATEAAEFAKQVNPNKLLLGHFSTRYSSAKPLEEEAKKIFKNSIAVNDGELFNIE